jgi:hypothetical protein
MAVHSRKRINMTLAQGKISANGHGYRYDVPALAGPMPVAATNLPTFGPGPLPLIQLTNLLFIRIYMFAKELKNECQNYQRRRNRQGHP